MFTRLEQETDPNYIQDAEYNASIKFPDNITPWCVRLVFDKMNLFMNRISIIEVKERLQRDFDLFIVNHKEGSRLITMRLYLGNKFPFMTRNELI